MPTNHWANIPRQFSDQDAVAVLDNFFFFQKKVEFFFGGGEVLLSDVLQFILIIISGEKNNEIGVRVTVDRVYHCIIPGSIFVPE